MLAEQTGVWGINHEESAKIFACGFGIPDSVGSRSFESRCHQLGRGCCSSLGYALHGRPSAQSRGLAARSLETGAYPIVEEKY